MRRLIYIYQQNEWPNFYWDVEAITPLLAHVRYYQGWLLGRMESLGFHLKEEAILHTLSLDVIKSSEIEGEILNTDQVRSSIARRLGIEMGGLVPADRKVEGIVEMMIDATQNYQQPLTKKRLLGWHAALFPTGYSGMHKITVGKWRRKEAGPMQIVSGAMGKEKIHFEAPEAEALEKEMQAFFKWFNNHASIEPVIKAAIAHLRFVTIHPFDDGNGRIARAIADMQLARADESPQRFYSMSAQIRKERKSYYEILEKTQKGDLNITEWLQWFLSCLNRSLNASDEILASIHTKAKFWHRHATASFNERQRLMLNKLLDDFEGKLTSSKWAKIAKCSPDTALRDIQDLMNRSILIKDNAGGRSTGYLLKKDADR